MLNTKIREDRSVAVLSLLVILGVFLTVVAWASWVVR
jgi:hypothetical protein